MGVITCRDRVPPEAAHMIVNFLTLGMNITWLK